MSIKDMLVTKKEEKPELKKVLFRPKKQKRYGRMFLMFLILASGIFTSLFPLFSIVYFSIIYAYMLLEFAYIVKKITLNQQEKTFFVVLEYFLLIGMIFLTFYFGSWLWAVCLGFVFISIQIFKLVNFYFDEKEGVKKDEEKNKK